MNNDLRKTIDERREKVVAMHWGKVTFVAAVFCALLLMAAVVVAVVAF